MSKRLQFLSNWVGNKVMVFYPAVPRLEDNETVYERVVGTVLQISDAGVMIKPTAEAHSQFHPWVNVIKLELLDS